MIADNHSGGGGGVVRLSQPLVQPVAVWSN